jgi:hypothetical protein
MSLHIAPQKFSGLSNDGKIEGYIRFIRAQLLLSNIPKEHYDLVVPQLFRTGLTGGVTADERGFCSKRNDRNLCVNSPQVVGSTVSLIGAVEI